MLLCNILGVFLFLCLITSDVSCEDGSTLAFAIDDTRSMWDDIDQVKKEAKAIMNVVLTEKSSQIKEFVLVTINDPDVILKTKTNSTVVFQRDLNSIRVHNFNNHDCEEMSMTGIEKALLYSRSGSYIYVFTDASSKDYHKVALVKRLCQKKQSQVVFVLTGDCGHPSNRMYTVYYEVAAACGGQVFRVKKDQVDEVLQTIKNLLKGKNPAIKWTMVPKSSIFLPVPFKIDEKADYAMVSTSGKNVDLRISTTNDLHGPAPKMEKIMWNENSKVVGLIDPLPGTYYAWVKGSSAVSVVVYARTDFTFEHGFSVLEPKSMKDTSKQPIAGKKQHLSINVTDPEQSVNIKLAQILDLNDDSHVIMELPLRKTDENFYITEPFISPTDMFKIAVTGETKKTGKPIRRISTTAVEPLVPIVVIPETLPNVKVDGTNLEVNYDSETTLTCRVSAHPAPKIEWLTSDNVLLPSESSIVEDTTYISYLKLKHIKQNETYACKATNKKGTGDSKSHVSVRPIFNPISIPGATTPAKYEEDVKIPCKIKSHLPFNIRWFWNGKELSSSGVHSISPDESELTLKSIQLGMEGKYTCEASLKSDPTVKQTHNTDVKITGLVLPIIEPSNKKIHVMKRSKFELKCKIVNGHPKPKVHWFKKNGAEFNPLPDVTGEILTIPQALFTHAGQYKCVAENVKGKASAEFEVTMSSLPEITIGETKRTFPYASNVEFTCIVESHPPPIIEWKDKDGSILQNKIIQISEYKYVNKLKLENVKGDAVYICVANNKVGSTTEHVNIAVPSPFEVEEHVQGDLKIQYGVEKTLRCDIKSSIPMKMQWYRTTGVKSSRSQIHTNDKYIISGNGTELKIKFMDTDMDGKYTCEASLLSDPEEKVSFSSNVNTVGLIGPEIVYSTSVMNKKNLTAICRVKGVPKPTISWQFQPKGSKGFTSIPGSGEELNIPELKLKHSGLYKCNVKNRLGEKYREFDVVVKERPIITFDKTTFFGVEGDLLLKIPCNVTGFPDPTVSWKKEGIIIGKDDPKYVIKGNALYIKTPMIADSTNFTCVAENELGMFMATFNTEVVDEFRNDDNFYGKSYNVYSVEGKPVAIKCNIIGSETRSVRWYMNGQKTNQTGPAYIIENASVFDDGNYTCRVDTDEGTKPENYVLDVGFVPTFVDDGPSSKDLSWMEDEFLDCTVNSKPEAKYEWFRNGKKLESENYKTHQVNDWGVFTCNVSNVHGSIQKTFKITSLGCYLTKNMGTPNKPLISDVNSLKWPYLMSNSDVLLKENEEIKLSCPSAKKSTNAFQMIPSKKEIVAKCNTQDKFIVDGKTYRYSELQCKIPVEPTIFNKHEKCLGPNSEMIQIGFGVDKFLETYKICYDSKLNVPIYGSATRTLGKIKNGVSPSEFKWSPALEVGGGKPTGGYTCKASGKCCYAKEQLVNFNEMPFGPSQVAMFKENLNSIAVWNPCDGSGRTSWQDFERELRDMSGTYESWASWTGASNYAAKNGGLVPRYLWKVMSYEDASSVMVYVNDESPVPSDIRCTKPCESMNESSDKYLYCCSIEEFSEVFGVAADKLITP